MPLAYTTLLIPLFHQLGYMNTIETLQTRGVNPGVDFLYRANACSHILAKPSWDANRGFPTGFHKPPAPAFNKIQLAWGWHSVQGVIFPKTKAITHSTAKILEQRDLRWLI